MGLTLSVLPGEFAVCRLPPDSELSAWVRGSGFISVTRTCDELSIVCPESEVPAGVRCERHWRCLRFDGPLEFSLIGVLAGVLSVLAEAMVSVFVVSTYETDYVFVRSDRLETAVSALRAAGYGVVS